MQFLFAATEASHEAGKSSLFEALGIDFVLLAQQGIAFLILVAILAKFVYPPLIKAIDNRRETIEASLKDARKSQEELAQTEAKIADMLAEARTEADGILARSHQEAVAMVAEAETKARTRSESFLKDAHAQLDADVMKARQALKQDTMQLVVMATEGVLKEKLDPAKDTKLVERELAQERA